LLAFVGIVGNLLGMCWELLGFVGVFVGDLLGPKKTSGQKWKEC
jgi:hypothetical protein